MVSVSQFRSNIKTYVDKAIFNHEPLVVNRKKGEDFVVISLDDYQREQETLYILSNNSLMRQIQKSLITHNLQKGYKPSQKELDEINSF